MAKAKELTGQRFGKLTVLYRAGNDRHGKAIWVCRCDCGAEREVLGANLLSGHTSSCGCTSRRDLAGERMGHLEVLGLSEHKSGRGKRTERLWECRCDCGETVYRATDSLMRGDTNMCAACAEKYAAERMRAEAGYVDGTQISRIRSERLSAANSSGARGVYLDRRTGRWRARLKFKGKLMNFGSYSDFNDAVKARRQAEEEYFGEFLREAKKGG